ncbi:hypothetical protein XdyCFBP7245_18850 [Xanthomonas dyei]|uniref:Integrase catalytic domain-containing protein n=1 Tax=Xanthomonas dyei TaxID=743699 RepID=A0A2S7BYC3_9XANT|nr:hypothetical protein XdyCFBP7245_18850 [Xanthomonas dyei]
MDGSILRGVDSGPGDAIAYAYRAVLQALMIAVWRRKSPAGLLVHSDQSKQFTGHDWQDFLKAQGLVSSMSLRGNCHDNAFAESFFLLLKRKRIKRRI